MISFARRLADLAAARPDAPAVTCGADSVTRAELEGAAERLARHLAGLGVAEGDMVTIALPNSVGFVVALVASWKLGATPQPVSARLPGRELEAVVELADSKVVIGAAVEGRSSLASAEAPDVGGPPLPDAVSPAWKAPTSGGSTGRPKLIVSGDPSLMDPDARPTLLIEPDGCMMMPGPLYHNGPLVWSSQALLAGNHLVLLPRFDPVATLAGIEAHRADIAYMVPTMMKRIWRMPAEERERYDLSSLRVIWHLAEPCPIWLKQAFIDWLGAERIVELYAGTEAQTATIIFGPDWLAHRGSVGKPAEGSVTILDADGNELPAGEQGEVWMRSVGRDTPTYRYVGAEARTREGGWESLGDMGWLDADGYLFLGDRSADMILSGGANIYPAEIESAINEHPAVRSCAVIGLPDDDMGNRVHALLEADPAIDLDELRAFLAERVVTYKIPRSFEVVSEPLRDDAGKVRRSALRAERIGAAS